jgi:DNA repair exonuclease SbcCD nuclease subunit
VSVTFLHTADWQLGKPFARVSDVLKRSLLQQERLAVLDRMGEVARNTEARFILVSGDLMDSPTATKAGVSAACAAIGALRVPVYAIPGNHDPGGPGSLWEQPFFLQEREKLAPNFHVLLVPEPVVLGDVVLLPCPLQRRHMAEDPSGWVRAVVRERAGEWGDRVRIVLMHGSVQGFSSAADEDDGENRTINRLDLEAMPMDAVDYVALGDWHGCKQVGPKAWYAGTPEPDRFPKGEQRTGQVLAVTVARGQNPQVQAVPTGRIHWHSEAATLSGAESLAALETRFDALLGGRVQQDVVRLELDGALGLEDMSRLDRLIETLEARVLRLRVHHRVVAAPTPEEAAALAGREGDPLLARVAARLLAAAQDSSRTEEAEIAQAALRQLYLALPQPAR